MEGGFHKMAMDSMEWLMDSMCLVGGFHGFSDGFHGMVDGFHGFPDGFHIISYVWWVDSMDFQMDSICLVGGFHGFPDGFHIIFRMESIWIPHGMSSWNNNSTQNSLFLKH